MAGFPGLNHIDEFAEDVMDYEFYGKTSPYESIYELSNMATKTTTGALGATQAAGGPHTVIFGNGNNQQLPFEPRGHFQQHMLKFNAADAWQARSADRGRLGISGFLRRLPSLRIPGTGLISSILGKRPVADPQEDDGQPAARAGKRRRHDNGDAIDDKGWERVEFSQKGFQNLTPLIYTETNTVWVRPQRKVWKGVWAYLQPAEDKTWTVDPHKGSRIQAVFR